LVNQADVNDQLQVRIFTLADYAVIPPDNKIYISGGAVDQMHLQQIPGALGSLTLAVRVRIPWQMTTQQISFRVLVLDADRQALVPDPLIQGEFEVGRPAGSRPGDELAIQFVVPLTGFPVQQEGTIYFHLIIEDQTLSILPLRVRRAVVAQITR